LINRYFEVENGKNILLITEFGKWTMLSKEEYIEFLKKGDDCEEKVIEKLKNAFIILDKDNIQKFIKYLNIRYGYLTIPMINIQINPTYKCNLSCIYCHASSETKGDVLDEDKANEIIDFINKVPKPNIYVEFQGGEPLLVFDKIQYIVEKLEKTNKKVRGFTLVTNLTLIDSDIAKFLEKYNFSVMGSLDVNEEIHNLQRPFANGSKSYNYAYNGFLTLLEKDIKFDVRSTITKICIKKYGFSGLSRELIRNAKKHGLHKINYMPVTPQGKATDNAEILLNAEEMFELVKTCSMDAVKEDMLDKFIFPYLCNIFSPMRKYSCLRDICGAGTSNITISPKGDIYPCDVIKRIPEWKIGEIKNGKATYNKEKLAKWISISTKSNPLCCYCEWQGLCNICKSCNYQEFGRLTTYHFLSETCKFHKKLYKFFFENIEIFRQYYNKFLKTYS